MFDEIRADFQAVRIARKAVPAGASHDVLSEALLELTGQHYVAEHTTRRGQTMKKIQEKDLFDALQELCE